MTKYGPWKLETKGDALTVLHGDLLTTIKNPHHQDLMRDLIKSKGDLSLSSVLSRNVSRDTLSALEAKILRSFGYNYLVIDPKNNRIVLKKSMSFSLDNKPKAKDSEVKSPASAKSFFASAAEKPVWIYVEDRQKGTEKLTFRGQKVSLEDDDSEEMIISALKAGNNGYSLAELMSDIRVQRDEAIEMMDALIEELRTISIKTDRRNPANRPQQYVVFDKAKEALFVCNTVDSAQGIRDANDAFSPAAVETVHPSPEQS